MEKKYASCRWKHPDTNGRAVDFDYLRRPTPSFGRPKCAPLKMPLQHVFLGWSGKGTLLTVIGDPNRLIALVKESSSTVTTWLRVR
jgi:hypothetical protein